ncbi:MAG TPA: bifunctional serine/threonine-protein kinase/formylglycine-generating enzyme family protein [bacterium]|nr:bifunctional serine/threonine-protein kinase/formylglycine-generating enzyme family protein [bacterium]
MEMTEQYQGIGSARIVAPPPREALGLSPRIPIAASLLAALFDSRSGSPEQTPLGDLLHQGWSFGQAWERLSPDRRESLNHQLSPTILRELSSLSEETDPEIFFEGLLHLAHRQRQQRPEFALACFSLIRESLAVEFPGRPDNHQALVNRAQRESDAIEGRGAVGARVEYLAGNFIRETTSPIGLASMALGGFAYSTVRTGMLARLLVGNAGTWTRGLGARTLASGVAFGAELPAFVLSGRVLHQAGGQAQDWSLQALGRDFATAGITLGLLKVGGAGAGAATRRWAQGGGILPQATRMLLPQAAMFTGILAAHRVEQGLSLRPTVDGATTLTDAFSTFLQFIATGRLLETSMGPRYAALQRELHARSDILAYTPPRRGSSSFGNLTAPQLALAAAAPRSRAAPDPRTAHLVFNSKHDGDPPPPPGPQGSTRATQPGPGQRRPTQPTAAGGLAARVARESRNKVPQIVPGTRLGPGPDGRFEVVSELGEGGAGRVFLVKDTREVAGTRSERLAVIKVPLGVTDAGRLHRIVREIRISENLGSGWAAPVYDHFEWPPGSGIHVPVMEYVDGHVFTDIINGATRSGNSDIARNYPLAKRIDLFAELCLGVHDAHNHGVLHKDLKPDNLRVDRNGRIRILDWGAAQHFTQPQDGPGPSGLRHIHTGDSEISGTPGYVPPEVVSARQPSNPRVRDIFSLGVILYETATGVLPFGVFREGDKARGEPSLVPEWEIVGQTRYQRIPDDVVLLIGADKGLEPPAFRRVLVGEFPPYLAEIEQIARRAMHVNPEERFQSAAELREAVLMARARADRESLNELKRARVALERQVTDSWDWRRFNVLSKTDPTEWIEGQNNLQRLREMRKDWREGVNDLTIRLYEATMYEHIAQARQMIAEISWEKLEDGGDRLAPGERRRLEQRIRDNDFELPSGRMFSEVLTGTAEVRVRPRSTEPNLDINPRIRVIPWEREIDHKGHESGNFRPGAPIVEGVLSEVREKLRLPAGYYAFEFYEPGFTPINVPVHVSLDAVRNAVVWRRPISVDATFAPREAIPKHMRIVQGGIANIGQDFYHEGMPFNNYSFPMRAQEIPTFAIAENLVTVREYARFISALLAKGEVAAALEYMPRKGPVPARSSQLTSTEVSRIFKEEENSSSRTFYWRIVSTFSPDAGHVYRLVNPTKHLDPNGDPIHYDQPINAISPNAGEAYVRWRSEVDGVRYRLATADEKNKVDTNSFEWVYPWGYDFSPYYGIFRLAFQGDRNQTAFPQPIGRHPMGQEYYRDFTIYGTRDNLGNVREFTGSEGEPGTVVLSGGSVRVPYGPFYLPGGRNYPILRNQVFDSIGGLRLAMDLPSILPLP